MTTHPHQTRGSARALDWLLRLVAAAGLAVDAGVHANLAGDFDAIKDGVSQGELFRVEAGAASLVALLALLFAHRAWVYAAVASVAGGGLGAVVVYRYVNVGGFGPFPNMYEPVWYFQKTLSAYAEAAALVAGIFGLVLAAAIRRDANRSASADELPT